jgi:hypothetical protein
MRPIFTVHAGEFLVGQHIESNFRNARVWVPTKDVGVDLLVTNNENSMATSLQVKFSRDFLPTMKLEASTLLALRSCTWFSLDHDKIAKSGADLWVLVLLGFEKRTYDYLIVSPTDLYQRLIQLHGSARRYQVYVWVTKNGQAWLTRGLEKHHQQKIAEGVFDDKGRNLTDHLNNWKEIEALRRA